MKLDKLVNLIIPILCGALLVVMVVLTFLQIIFREFYDFSMSWSDEVSQFCMTWMVLLGLIWVSKNNQHLNTGLKLHKKLKERQIRLIDSLLTLIIAVVTGIVAYHGAVFAWRQWGMESLSISWVKLGYIFIVLPIAMLAMCYCYSKDFFKNLIRLFKKN
jgi:TRAP-type C4-dicarboxylate transport system permease small subunit